VFNDFLFHAVFVKDGTLGTWPLGTALFLNWRLRQLRNQSMQRARDLAQASFAAEAFAAWCSSNMQPNELLIM
jgi:hypothetical protein